MRALCVIVLMCAACDSAEDVAPAPPPPPNVAMTTIARPVPVLAPAAVEVEDDRDSDDIPDVVDRCPDQPEDIDGFEDNDGCPDVDRDVDPVLAENIE